MSASPLRIVAYTDTQHLGGADLALSHVLERLDPNVSVTVFGVNPSIVTRVAAGRPSAATKVVRQPRSGHDLAALAAHLDVLRAAQPDIVHVSLASPWSCQYAIVAGAILRRPRIVAVYQLPRPPINRRQRWLKRLTSRSIASHVAVGERTSREIEQLLAFPQGTVRTIHNGVPDLALPERPRPIAGPVVGALGRLEHQKGFDVLLRALAEVPEATGVIVGDGDERETLRALAHDLGIAGRVRWFDWSDDPRAYLPWFDVFVLPSRFEAFPLALLEALLARKAVVATNVGSVAEAVLPEQTGLLVPPDDIGALAGGVRRLLADDALRTRLGARGRELVLARFTAEHMTHGFQRLYCEILP